jgi:ketosteroid isomerase-like protein
MSHQRHQELEGLGRQTQRATAQQQKPLCRVEGEIAELENLACGGGHRKSKKSPKTSIVTSSSLPVTDCQEERSMKRGTRFSPGRRFAAASCLALVLGSIAAGTVMAAPEDEVRAAFERFVAAQNAHDEKAVAGLLLDSPDFLWITRGNAVWGREPAMKRFAALYQGTWQLAPDPSGLKVMMVGEGVAQLFVPIDFTIGSSGQPAQRTRFLMNQVLRKTADGWKVSSILPIPAPAP